MARLADLLEDYRNALGRANWSMGRDIDIMSGYDPDLAEFVERSSLGTGAHGLGAGGLAGMIKASHGSPHAFEKFSLSKIGTGEGAQAYGHGGYFAQGFDSPVAKEYQKQLAADVQLRGKPFYSGKTGKQTATTGNPELDDYLLANLGDVNAARSNLLADLRDVRLGGGDVKDYQKTLADLRSIRGDVETGNTGHLYNVELKWPDAAREAADPLGEHHLLDWDATLANQPQNIKNALSKLEAPGTGFSYGDILQSLETAPHLGDIKEYAWAHPTGRDIYNSLGETMMVGNKAPGQFEASNKLRKLGIPGIRYLDEGSRNTAQKWIAKHPKGGEWIFNSQPELDAFLGRNPEFSPIYPKISRNYVMFDDQFPNIVSRNGVSLSDLLKSETPQSKLNALIQNLESQGLNVDAFYNPKSNQVSLSRLVVPKESRGQGIGTKAMQDLIDFADEQNALMSLSPSTDFGATSINRLKDFYSRFGFVPNKGKYKDYSISESMYRPKK